MVQRVAWKVKYFGTWEFQKPVFCYQAPSNRSQIKFPLSKCFLQVYLGPINPESMKLQSSITSLNDYIWLQFLKVLPNFSFCLIISLESLAHNQGISRLLFKLLNLAQASSCFAVFGSPQKPVNLHSSSEFLLIITSL